MPSLPLRGALVACALLVAASACGDATRQTVPAADDRFARTYIHTLHDSGVVAVLGRTKRESAAVPAFAMGVEAMRFLLPTTLDSLHLVSSEVKPDSTTGAPVTRLVYSAHGGGRAAEVQVWLERENGQPVVEQVRIARRAP